MKGGMLGAGPVQATGTRLYDRPIPGALGKPRGTYLFPRDAPNPPDFAGAGAPCTRPEVDPDLWHPNGASPPQLARAAKAIALCQRCPMRVECRAWADDIRATSGIWGGEWLNYREGRAAS